jgi:hypothetical protein
VEVLGLSSEDHIRELLKRPSDDQPGVTGEGARPFMLPSPRPSRPAVAKPPRRRRALSSAPRPARARPRHRGRRAGTPASS